MDNYTIKSTVRKDQLPGFLSDVKDLFERVNQEPPSNLHIKSIPNGGSDNYCEVTINSSNLAAGQKQIH